MYSRKIAGAEPGVNPPLLGPCRGPCAGGRAPLFPHARLLIGCGAVGCATNGYGGGEFRGQAHAGHADNSRKACRAGAGRS